MKKTRFIALVLVVAVMLLGAGYAWWTDYTVINGTVDTGELDVNIQWASLIYPEYAEGSVGHDDNSITFNVSKLYPTKYGSEEFKPSYARLHFSIKNEGTVPAKLSNIRFTPTNESSDVWDYLKTVIHIHYGIPSATGTSLTTKGSLTGTNPLRGKLEDLETLLTNSPCTLQDFVLMPGEAIWFGANEPEKNSLRIYLDKEAPNDITENESIGFKLEFDWVQYNYEQ